MPGGRPPKPLELKEGNAMKAGGIPDPVVIGGKPFEVPPPPEHLGDDGKAFWNASVPYLYEIGVLDRVDTAALEMAANAYQRWHQARRIINAQGVLTRAANGDIREHPALRTEREAAAQYLRFAEQFGLTASARARLGIAVLQGREMLDRQLERELGETELKPA